MKNKLHASAYRLAYLRRLAGVVGSIFLTFALWYLFILTQLGQAVDSLAMFILAELNRDFFAWDQLLLREIYWFLVIPTLSLALLVVIFRRRWMLLWRMVIMVAVTVFGVQLLKHGLLYRPNLGITFYISNSYPSGHTATAAAGAAALLMVSPARWRPLLTHLMAAYLTIVGLAVTVAQWHRPADVFGAFAVAMGTTLLLAPVEDDRSGPLRLDREGKRGKYLSATSFGLLLSLLGLGLMGYVTYQLRVAKVHFQIGNATEYLQTLASQHAPLAIVLAVATILLILGFAWYAMAEVAQVAKNRAGSKMSPP